ncbi:unnamed protein product [Caenorhabditis nigoni]
MDSDYSGDEEYVEENDEDLSDEDQVVAMKMEDNKFMTHGELEIEMKKTIAEVQAVLQIQNGICRILLHKFKWNKEALFDKFYDCLDMTEFLKSCQIIRKSEDEESHKGECDICVDLTDLVGLSCGHLACSKCWKAYITEKIVDGRQSEIECLASKCDLLIEDEKIRTILSDSLVLDAYDYHKVNGFVMTNPFIKWCPGKNCGRAVKVFSTDSQLIECECGARFCFCCYENWHEPVTCELQKQWVIRCKSDSETANWIMAHTKECPKCHTTIEKNGGCNHMSCQTRSCMHEFCWLCMKPWRGHTACNSYVDKNEQQRTNSRQSLERYLFYYNRYRTHEQSLQLEMKLKNKVAIKMDQIANATKAYVEGKCLEQAVEVLSQCRQTMMYSYVFAFYLQKDNNSQIFEDNQKDLEAATENLSELLEKDIDEDDYSKLFKLVQDKSRYVDVRRKVLLEHCVEGYDKNFWKFTTAAFR